MAGNASSDPYSRQESASCFPAESDTPTARLVSSPEQAVENIARYQSEFEDALFGTELKRRMKRVNA